MPCYFPISPGSNEVALSFGKDFAWVVDPAAEVATDWEERYQCNGALLVGLDRTLLRVYPMDLVWGSGWIHYDVASGAAVQAPDSHGRYCAILSWDIRLPPQDTHPPLRPIITFNAAP